MPIETSVEGDVVTFRATGTLTGPQVMAAVTAHFSRAPTRLAFWDLREAFLSGINALDFEMMIRNSERYASARGANPRAAIVTKDGADAMLAKAYQARTQVGEFPIATRFFVDPATARAWLLSE